MTGNDRELYEFLNNAIYTQCENVDITCIRSSYAISPGAVNMIFKEILDDNPQYFWFEGKWKASATRERVIIKPVYGFDRESRSRFEKRIEDITGAVAKEILVSCQTSDGCLPDETQLIRSVYDWILNNVTYGKGRRGGQTVYDALIDGEALCKGLSKTMQLLLSKLGIRSHLRSGTIDGLARHVWNVVEIDGSKYNIDVSLGYGSFDRLYEGSGSSRQDRAFLVSDDELIVSV